MCGSLFFSLESCNAHRLVILVNFSLSSWEKDYQKSQTGSNLCFIPTPSDNVRTRIIKETKAFRLFSHCVVCLTQNVMSLLEVYIL